MNHKNVELVKNNTTLRILVLVVALPLMLAWGVTRFLFMLVKGFPRNLVTLAVTLYRLIANKIQFWKLRHHAKVPQDKKL